MTHAEAEYRGREVISDFLLLSVEAHALRYVSVTRCAEDVEWHLEPHSLLVAAESRCLLAVELVGRCLALELGRDISSVW